MRTLKPIAIQGALCDEIAHWLFLERWDDPLPWCNEKHLQVKIATDASRTGWEGHISTPVEQETSDYWSKQEMMMDIATTGEALAVERVLLAFKDHVEDCRVNVMIDNQAVMHVWNNQGGKSRDLNAAIKALFFTTMDMNILLHMVYVPTQENPADGPSCRLSHLDCKLAPEI